MTILPTKLRRFAAFSRLNPQFSILNLQFLHFFPPFFRLFEKKRYLCGVQAPNEAKILNFY